MARTKDFDEKEVLCKAVDLFWHKGYNGTSMQDLVDGLGISRSSLYDTYGDKHTLFVKALESYQCESSGRICAIVSDNEPAQATITKLLGFVVDGLLGDAQQKGCFMVNAEVEVAPHDAQVNRMISDSDRQMEDVFYSVIKKGQAESEISAAKDARALARFIFNTMKGIQVTAKSTKDRVVFDDIVNMAVSVLA